jgi:perosamine synthetase
MTNVPKRLIPIYKPYLPIDSLNKAHDALDSTWLSSQGKYIQIAQEKLQELLGVSYVLPVNNGTSACHLVAKALNRKIGKQPHKILCPDNVYVAAWNAFLFDTGLFELITIKTDINTWNIDLEDLDKKINIHPEASILIVHNMGNVINVPELQKKYPNNIFVEDACESFMGTYENKYTGTASFISAFSTFGNKTITSGEGGFITTNDESTYLYVKHIHGQGQSSKKFIHNKLGYNYRITNIQAALLCGQLEIVEQIVEMKRNIFDKYRAVFGNRNDVLIQKEANNTQHANWMFGLRILNNKSYDLANSFFSIRNIEIRPLFYAISEHEHLKKNENIIIDDTANAELLNKQVIILPSFPELTTDEQDYIITTVNQFIRENI